MQHDTTTFNKVVKWYKLFLHSKCCTLLYEKLGSFDWGLKWILGDDTVDELYEYKNLGVLKNYIGSFSSNIEDKTRKNDGMIFPSNFDHRKVNSFIYIKFWRQACLPSLLDGSELFTLIPFLLAKLERCRQWVPQKYFLCTKFRSQKTSSKTVRSELY